MAFEPTQTTATLLICDFVGTATLTASSTSATVLFHSDGVGLNEDDFIVNETRSDTSRRILDIPIAGVYDLLGTIENQTQDDIVRQYSFTDHTDILKDSTLNVVKRIEEETFVSFTLVCDSTYIPRAGQMVKIKLNGQIAFLGKIVRAKRRLPQTGIDTKIFVDIECGSLRDALQYRTVSIAYEVDTTSSDIINSLTETFLVSEGITTGTIDTGVILPDDWYDDALSISDIFDSLAEQSGYQWFIDNTWNVQFYQDTTVSTYSQTMDASSTASFIDFRNVTIEETLDNYNNKAFYVGNTDDYGNLIVVSKENTASIDEIQDYSAGSGVYGTVVRDSNLQSHDFYNAEAGTTETEIVITGADSLVTAGDLIYNIDGFARVNVSSVSGNTITTQAISGQTEGQVIAIYEHINDVVDNHLKRSSVIPRKLEFDSFTTDFEPAQKLQFESSKLSVSTEYYVIEEVNIQDRGANYMVAHVVASKRDNSDFSTQKTPDYRNYYKEF